MDKLTSTARCSMLILLLIALPACQLLNKGQFDKPADETRYGQQKAAQIMAVTPLVENEPLQQYINHVGSWVAQQSSRPNLPWRFGLVKSDSIASFALPGGTVLITTGLFALLENEAQLAAIIAHDVAHIDSRHYVKALKKSDWQNLLSNGLPVGRDFDADRNATVFLARAGYDAYAMLDILTTLSAIDPNADEMTYLNATHPPAEHRLSILVAEMDAHSRQFENGQLNTDRFLRFAR